MQAASRQSLGAAQERLTATIDGLADEQLAVLADELFAVLDVLVRERVLRRHLADPGAEDDARRGLARGVFGGRVSTEATDVVVGLAGSRWSQNADLLQALERLAVEVALARAERDGSLDDVEDELFRFGRIVDSQPRLRELLADSLAPVDGRVGLLDELVADKVRPVTRLLLEQAVRVPRGRSLELVVAQLAELAAARRGRSVALVTASAPLTDDQERRLAAVLSEIFGRTVAVQVELDPELLGGLVIRVGDEVIDGSVAARLAAARQQLPS